jgi:hypothetical protein
MLYENKTTKELINSVKKSRLSMKNTMSNIGIKHELKYKRLSNKLDQSLDIQDRTKYRHDDLKVANYLDKTIDKTPDVNK